MKMGANIQRGEQSETCKDEVITANIQNKMRLMSHAGQNKEYFSGSTVKAK